MGSSLNTKGRFECVRARGPRDHQLHFVLKWTPESALTTPGWRKKTSELYILSLHPSRAFLDLSEVSVISEDVSPSFCDLKTIFFVPKSGYLSFNSKTSFWPLSGFPPPNIRFSLMSLCAVVSFQVWVCLSEDLASRIFQLCTKIKPQKTQFFYSSNGHSLTAFLLQIVQEGKAQFQPPQSRPLCHFSANNAKVMTVYVLLNC